MANCVDSKFLFSFRSSDVSEKAKEEANDDSDLGCEQPKRSPPRASVNLYKVGDAEREKEQCRKERVTPSPVNEHAQKAQSDDCPETGLSVVEN